jgi:hypothetical protein
MRMLANAPRAASIPRRGRWACRLSPRVYSIASGNLTTMWAACGPHVGCIWAGGEDRDPSALSNVAADMGHIVERIARRAGTIH